MKPTAATRVIAIDLAKLVFQVCVLSISGKVESNREVKRAKLVDCLRQFDPSGCIVAMEACFSAHYWGRVFQGMGFEVRLVPAQHVKAFCRTHKSDARDAVAIGEASLRPNLHCVPVKSVAQQDLQLCVRMRTRQIQARVALANQLRSLLAEYGVIVGKSLRVLRAELPDLLEHALLTPTARRIGAELQAELKALDDRIEQADRALVEALHPHPAYARLQQVPGIGPVVAASLLAAIGAGTQFRNGRQLAAWAGLVPRQCGSGGKTALLGITKNGDRTVRTVLIHGARAVVHWSKRRSDPLGSWVRGIQQRRGSKRAVVALANKIARFAFQVIVKGAEFDVRKAFA
jgi:transposase